MPHGFCHCARRSDLGRASAAETRGFIGRLLLTCPSPADAQFEGAAPAQSLLPGPGGPGLGPSGLGQDWRECTKDAASFFRARNFDRLLLTKAIQSCEKFQVSVSPERLLPGPPARARFFVAKVRIGELTALHDSSIKLETVWTNWKNSEGSCILLLSICAIREIKFLVAKVSHVTTQAACPGLNLVRPRFTGGPRGSSRRYSIFQIRSFKFKLPRRPWRP